MNNAIPRVVGNVGVVDGAQDAFGRIRVSNPTTLFEGEFQYGKQPFVFDEDNLGAGSVSTHIPLESSIQMAVDVADGDAQGAGYPVAALVLR